MAHQGVVKSFNPVKGWGFVESNGQDVFLLKSALKGHCVEKGDQIRFSIEQGNRGPQACDVQVIGDVNQTFFGNVRTFNPTKGYGFIESEATTAMLGKDVFLLRSQLPDGHADEGDACTFQVVMSEKGQPQATNVKILGSGKGGGKGGGKGSFSGKGMADVMNMSPEMMQQMMWMWQMSTGQQLPDPNAKGAGKGMPTGPWRPPSETDVFYGIVKNINSEKGWGHIDCETLQAKTGKDVFVMQSAVQEAGLALGMHVTFNVAQGVKGLHAVNIKKTLSPAQAASRMYSGQVKSFNETKGWGFITCPQASQQYGVADIFVHSKDLNGQALAEGQPVQFSVDISGGRAAAKNVIASGYGAIKSTPANGKGFRPY